MARSYHVATASIAVGCNLRWLDNLLSRYDLPGVAREQRGVARTISSDALELIAIVHALATDLELPLAASVDFARQLHAASDSRVVLPSGLSLEINLTRLRRELDAALLDAAESHVVPRRGRPPRKPPSAT